VSNAIIVHGEPGRDEYYDPDVPSSSNHHWLPWLAKQFIRIVGGDPRLQAGEEADPSSRLIFNNWHSKM
jgi:hypothetical protein